MAKIQTYITQAEATRAFPGDQEYTSDQRTDALDDSFGLVNSHIASTIKVPAVEPWDGESGSVDAPRLLKHLQKKWYRYCLRITNHGETDDLREIREGLEEQCEGVTQEKILVPEIQKSELDVGFHITKIEHDKDNGGVEIQTITPPTYSHFYELEITTGGYPGTIVFSVYRDDSSTARYTGKVGEATWVDIDEFRVRFLGQWDIADRIHIQGVPLDSVNVSPPKSRVKQGYAGFA